MADKNIAIGEDAAEIFGSYPSLDCPTGELDLDIDTVRKLPDEPGATLQLTQGDCTQDTWCNCNYWSSVGTYFASCCT